MLDHTPLPLVERSALTINPAKTCQPIGATYAALGIHRCLPYSHGSQGCCSYHRSHLTRHFKEPVMAATSSFTGHFALTGIRRVLRASSAAVSETARLGRRGRAASAGDTPPCPRRRWQRAPHRIPR